MRRALTLLSLLLCLLASALLAPGAVQPAAADAKRSVKGKAASAARTAACKRQLSGFRRGRKVSKRCRIVLRALVRSTDRKAPRLAFRAPLGGGKVAGRLTGSRCLVDASDASGLDRVTFTVDGRAVGTRRVKPYRCAIDTAKLAAGDHTIRAVAYDNAGNRATARVTVEVERTAVAPAQAKLPAAPQARDATAPILAWKAPTAGATVTTKLENDACEVSAVDERGIIDRVVFTVDGKNPRTVRTAPYTCAIDPATLSAGTHQITAVAYDGSNNHAAASASFRVDRAAAPAPAPRPAPSGSRIFSPTSVWNAPLADNAALHPASAQMVGDLVRQVNSFGPWINNTQYSTPVYTVPASQPTVKVRLNRPTGAPVVDDLHAAFATAPLPADARPADGGDSHLVIHQPETDQMWEFWRLRRENGGWVADWGGHMRNVSSDNGVFDDPHNGWGATASSLPLLGGLMRLDELKGGRIDHALAMAIPQPKRGEVVWPAQRTDGSLDSPAAIPEGTRFRLPASLDLDALNLPPFTRMLAEAAQRYGMVVRDEAGAVVLFGEDPTPTKSDAYDQAYGGEWPNKLLGKFPWDKLQVVRP